MSNKESIPASNISFNGFFYLFLIIFYNSILLMENNHNIIIENNHDIIIKDNHNIITETNNDITWTNISDKINNIFFNIEKITRKFIKIESGTVTRNTIISFTDTLIYSILYTQHDKTKTDIVNELNIIHKDKDKNVIIKRTTIHDKETKIPFDVFIYIFKEIKKLYSDLFEDDQLTKLIAVDGTYNNTNVFNIKGYLETSLNLGFFDINNQIPLDLTFNGIKNKNNELKVLIKYIRDNKDKFKNVILILDRAYCSYSFIDFLNKNNIGFVCRFKNNCKFDRPHNKNRIIEFVTKTKEEIINKDIDTHLINNKKFNKVTIEIKDQYKLITNLDKDQYDNNNIIDIYHKRWDIEVFFKNVKNDFKFENLRISNLDRDDKMYYIHNIKILIVLLLSKIIEKTHMKINNIPTEGTITKRKYTNKKEKNNVVPYTKKEKKEKNKKKINKKPINVNIDNNEQVNLLKDDKENDLPSEKNKDVIDCFIKPNKSETIKCCFKLIYDIFYAKLNQDILKEKTEIFIKYLKTPKGISNKRTCKTPFKKWYIKGYTNKTDSYRMINYIFGFIDEVNINVKTKSKNVTIIEIDYVP
jgi:hypothetical protein